MLSPAVRLNWRLDHRFTIPVASAIRGSGDNHIVLQQKIPVYISYFTVRVNDDGSISTFGDIYGHDARMIAALNKKSVALMRRPTTERLPQTP